MAAVASPFAGHAAAALPLDSAAAAAASAAACSGPWAAARASADLDALLAASAAKPGYAAAAAATPRGAAASTPAGGSAPAAAAAAAPPMPGTAAAVAEALAGCGAQRIASGSLSGIAAAAAAAIAARRLCDTFYVVDTGEVARLHRAWQAALPRVAPFYAIKCNPDPGLVAVLAALGVGFDCASVSELRAAAAAGVTQHDRLIFANPCKRPADFRYAAEHGVRYTTFDTACELDKIAALNPGFKCVLRIRCDDAGAAINLGLKYGADLEDVPSLLDRARALNLDVAGVSFHVGSGCVNVGVYADAIAAAAEAFAHAEARGFRMELLDVGGGFTAPHDGASARLFYATAATINAALARHFPPRRGVRVIAEPGRYFAETAATLFTAVIGQRDAPACHFPQATTPAKTPPAAAAASSAVGVGGGADCNNGDGHGDNSATTPPAAPPPPATQRWYWLSDGTYGSFRILVAVDGLAPRYSVLRSPLLPPPTADDERPVPARLWGNSEADGDCVHADALLPSLRDGDWLMFPFAGAYTLCAASNYGGVAHSAPLRLFVHSDGAAREWGGFDVARAAAAVAAAAAADVAADAALAAPLALLGCAGGGIEGGGGGGGADVLAGASSEACCAELLASLLVGCNGGGGDVAAAAGSAAGSGGGDAHMADGSDDAVTEPAPRGAAAAMMGSGGSPPPRSAEADDDKEAVAADAALDAGSCVDLAELEALEAARSGSAASGVVAVDDDADGACGGDVECALLDAVAATAAAAAGADDADGSDVSAAAEEVGVLVAAAAGAKAADARGGHHHHHQHRSRVPSGGSSEPSDASDAMSVASDGTALGGGGGSASGGGGSGEHHAAAMAAMDVSS